MFVDAISFFAAVVWSKAFVDSAGGAYVWLYVGGACLFSLIVSVRLTISLEGGPSWSWQSQDTSRVMKLFFVSLCAWMCALGWASASHRSLAYLADTGDPIAVMSAWGTTACTMVSAVLLLTHSRRHTVCLLPNTQDDPPDSAPLLGLSGDPLESTVMHGEVFYLVELLVRKVFERRAYEENPSANSLLVFAMFVTGCSMVFIPGLERIAQMANGRLYSVVMESGQNGVSLPHAPAPSSFSLAVTRYSSRLENLEQTNDLVEAGMKGTAYLLALAWDRTIVALIFDRANGRLSDLWGYAMSAMVLAGLLSLFAVYHLNSHTTQIGRRMKDASSALTSQVDVGDAEL